MNAALQRCPMLFRVRICRMETGERLPLMVDHQGLPQPLPNESALLLRRRKVQLNTLASDTRSLAHVYDWAGRRDINLDGRLNAGNALTPGEVNSLFEYLRYEKVFARSVARDQLKDVKKAKVVLGDTHASRVRVTTTTGSVP